MIFNNSLSLIVANGKGELAALLAAALWAVASVLYGIVGQRIPPLQLNVIKGIVAIACLFLTILLTREAFPISAPVPIFLLCLSGVIGIGWGDTAFLAAINYLGARRVLLIGTLSPPVSAIAANIFLREQLNISAWCGILLTILGVAWVITERVTSDGEHSPKHLWTGISFGLLATMTNAVATVISRAALTTESVTPLWAALLRLSAAEIILLTWLWLRRNNQELIYPYWQSRRVIFATCFAAFCGTYLGIWLQQTAIKFTVTGVAATLLQTSPLFVIPIAVLMGEKVSWRAIAGVIIAIVGIGLLFYLQGTGCGVWGVGCGEE